jgi:hypothetical protein
MEKRHAEPVYGFKSLRIGGEGLSQTGDGLPEFSFFHQGDAIGSLSVFGIHGFPLMVGIKGQSPGNEFSGALGQVLYLI